MNEAAQHTTCTRTRPMRMRTCIATRKVASDELLLRCVISPDDPETVLADPDRKLPGRGAWISPTMEAFELAEKRRAFGRALRVSTPVDLGHVRTYLAELADGPETVRTTEH
ncbi:YlxR family protein [Corynebacterium breve]|uniref:YlxR family protein n=1 Tax=Corynebacterium breve TaxID=3049799 RepID=A0ABY8VB02_9CORY|nr:YlxR family protein [Corynebacterium breve]WIM66834.1 YlxR family protein [Corynebacterium breve]